MAGQKVGRPRLTDEQAAIRAAHVIDVAVMLRQGRLNHLARMGYSERDALRLIQKRYRGRVGEFIGTSVRELFPPINVAAAAARNVLELERDARTSGLPVTRARAITQVLKWYQNLGLDRANLTRALDVAERDSNN